MDLTAPDSSGAAAPAEEIREISLQELRRGLRAGSLALVDVLSAGVHALGHIPGALSLPVEAIGERAPTLLPDHAANIVVYCGSFT
jgi:rhodanese-related sulfurtransferase